MNLLENCISITIVWIISMHVFIHVFESIQFDGVRNVNSFFSRECKEKKFIDSAYKCILELRAYLTNFACLIIFNWKYCFNLINT